MDAREDTLLSGCHRLAVVKWVLSERIVLGGKLDVGVDWVAKAHGAVGA